MTTKYIVYSQENCPWCVKAARMLKSLDIPHEIKKYKNLHERVELTQKWSWATFPIIVTTGGELIGGYSELEKHLGLYISPVEERVNGKDVQVELTHELASMPVRGSAGAAGYDLTMLSASGNIKQLTEDPDSGYPTFALHPGERGFFRTGIKITLPKMHYGRIAPRSGLAAKDGIDVLAGVIDEDYRGELIVILQNLSPNITKTFQTGDKIAQLIITPYSAPKLVQVRSMDDSERGANGFGSTGR